MTSDDVVGSTVFARVDLDVFYCILSYLDIESVARFGQTCRFLHAIVEDHGWKCITVRNGTMLNRREIVPRVALHPADIYRELLQVDRAWCKKIFRSYQTPLPVVATTRGRREHRDQPQPLLLLTPFGLILFTGCEMRIWPSSILQRTDPLLLRQAQLFYLVNPAGLGPRAQGKPSLALWDICSCTQLDSQGKYIAFGRLNGLVEIIRVERGSHKHKGRIAINLEWICHDQAATGSVQSMHACPSSGLFAVAYKSGIIKLFQVKFDRNKLEIGTRASWKIGRRPWSIWVQDASWLAIGVNDTLPIILYPLEPTSSNRSIRLSNGTDAKPTAVYALQSQKVAGTCYLLAGCYDGTLRRYDINAALYSTTTTGGIHGETAVLPVEQVRDRFDPSAIYCLCDGVGENGMQVAAGTARYGVCKLFQLGNELGNGKENEAESWSMFAAHPSQSPTYSLVGQYDRLFGVTDAAFWQVDLRWRRSAVKRIEAADESSSQQKVAFYHHGDMILERSRWPGWPADLSTDRPTG